MTYKLEFKSSALKEWNKLGSTLQQQLKKKLKTPHVAPDRVLGADNVYKIKLRQSGYRLVYQVLDDVVVVTVLAVGKRERNEAYKKALKRLDVE